MKPLFIGVLPNFEPEEYRLARKLLLTRVKETERDDFAIGLLKQFYPAVPAEKIVPAEESGSAKIVGEVDQNGTQAQLFTVDSARSAFHLLLKTLNLSAGSEVILPAFTCVVIVNPVLWNGLVPVYVDHDPASLNNSVDSLLAAVTKKTKLVLVQHTFGLPVSVSDLRKGLEKLGRTDIVIVEDLAHSLGEDYPEQNFKLGTQADYAVCTFGVEKMISTIRGGALLVNKTANTEAVYEEFRYTYEPMEEMSGKQLWRLLLNPLFWLIAIPTYNLGFGKYTLGKLLVQLGHMIGLLGIQIDNEEYRGGKPDFLPVKLHPKLAAIGNMQLPKLPRFNNQRRKLAAAYHEVVAHTSLGKNPEQKLIGKILEKEMPHAFHRYPLVLPSSADRKKVVSQARSQGIVLGDWYKSLFYTDKKYLKRLGYISGSAANVEDIQERIVNLPTGINVSTQHLQILKEILRASQGGY